MKAASRQIEAPPRLEPRGRSHLWLWATGLTAFGLACLLARFYLDTGLGWRCPVMSLWHIPCPSCGSTRALAALSEGQVLRAWRFNPLIITASLVGPFGWLWRGHAARYSRLGWPVFFGLVFLNWLYLLVYLPH